MARKKTQTPKAHDLAKIDAALMRDARIIVAITGEGLSEYLNKLLAPLIARDKKALMKKEMPGSE